MTTLSDKQEIYADRAGDFPARIKADALEDTRDWIANFQPSRAPPSIYLQKSRRAATMTIVSFAACMLGLLGVEPVFAEPKLAVESYIGVAGDDFSNTIVITNSGEEIQINSLTLNRAECRLELYQPSGNGAETEMSNLALPIFMAFNDDQRKIAADSAEQTFGRTTVKKVILMKTGDQVVVVAPSVVPSLRAAGFRDAGNCGSALINMTAHTSSGDLYFEW